MVSCHVSVSNGQLRPNSFTKDLLLTKIKSSGIRSRTPIQHKCLPWGGGDCSQGGVAGTVTPSTCMLKLTLQDWCLVFKATKAVQTRKTKATFCPGHLEQAIFPPRGRAPSTMPDVYFLPSEEPPSFARGSLPRPLRCSGR